MSTQKKFEKYEMLKDIVFKKLMEVFDKAPFRLINQIEKVLERNGLKNYENSQQLIKQLSYDYLVKKRRDESNLEKCANPSNWPEDKSPLDKKYLIDCLTAWTEKWEDLKCNDIEFRFLKNLDAPIVVLLKDSTGKITYKKFADEMKEYPQGLSEYINKSANRNPFDFGSSQYRCAYEWRIGFSPDVKTNIQLRNMIHKYLNQKVSSTESGEVCPIENENIFMSNSFVFLSAGELSPSMVPDKIFEMSVKKYILPLLNVIKPKYVFQCGSDAQYFTKLAISNLQKEEFIQGWSDPGENLDLGFNKLQKVHETMSEKKGLREILLHINWSHNQTTFFLPVTHPSRPRYYNNGRQDSHVVWGQFLVNAHNLHRDDF